MFGKNEIVGQKYFADAKENSLLVTSMFFTLQGEGPFRGEPALFIRLAKCNLACSFCDTYFDSGDWLTFDEIKERIEKTIDDYYAKIKFERPDWTRHELNPFGEAFPKKKMVLVITGGEPTLQKNLVPFLVEMNKIFDKTQIESNGIFTLDLPKETCVVVSPKCLEDKTGKAIKYINPKQEMLDQAYCLKFVMEANPESPYSNIPDWAHKWAKVTNRPIFISPMNIYNSEPQKAKELRANKNMLEFEERSTVDEVISFWEPGLLDMAENQKNHEYAARFCVNHGYILNLQIHLYASLA